MIFKDIRTELPQHATKRFNQRLISGIVGGVVHHTAGRDNPYNTAAYHVGPNHVSESGCPGLLYTFYISLDGVTYWCNDIRDITWSQGGHGSPVPGTDANTHFIAIVCGGDFSKSEPTFAQMLSLLSLWGHLTGHSKWSEMPDELHGVLKCSVNALYGHHNFGKPACPGLTLTTMVDAIRSHYQVRRLNSDAEWQQVLNAAGYPLEVDGIWGPLSKAALVEFQRDNGLVVDGIRGPLTEAALLC